MKVSEATRRRLNRPAVVMLLSLILTGAVVGVRLATFDRDPSRFVIAGDGLVDPERAPRSLYVIAGSYGYDGQAFYRLALDPLTDTKVDHGVTLDTPSYRQQRIGYPGLAWVVSGGGDPDRVPWALIAINVVAMGAIGWAGGALAVALGRHALWGSVFALYPGFVVSVARDLAEPMASAFMLVGLLLLRRSRSTGAALALTAAMLTRETTAVVPIGLALAWFFSRVTARRTRPVREFAVPLGVMAVWQLFLYARWSSVAALANENATDLPFRGLGAQVERYLSSLSSDALLSLVEIALAAVLVVGVLYTIGSGGVLPHERWAFIAAVLPVVLLDASVWNDHAHFLRALSELFLLGATILLAAMRSNPARFAAPVVLLWAGIASIFARHL